MGPSDDRLDRANQVFSDALDLPSAERDGFVRRACGNDPGLSDSVLKLLSRFNQLGDFLETPAAAPRFDLWPGDVLDDRVRIVEFRGRGGMGEVYRAEDLKLGEPVAVKIVRAEWRSDPAVLARFHDEIKLARRVSHPNVCRVHGILTASIREREIVCLEMEYLEGESLAALLASHGKLDSATAVRIATGIAAGLDAAHREGVVHRDLKPGNVILARDRRGEERPVITDFGLARSEDPGHDSHTQSGMIAGSPDYMAPEQFLGEPPAPTVDIFAFGLIIYEMAAGRRPYPSEGIVRTAARRLMEAPPLLSNAAPDAPRHWDRVLARALAREPKRRYQAASALVEELRERPSRATAALAGFRPPKLSRRGWLMTAGAAAVSSVPLIYLTRRESAHVAEGAAMLVVPLENDTGDHQLDGAGDILQGQLHQSAFFNIVSDTRIRFLLDRMTRGGAGNLDANTARELAWRGGIPLVVFGSLGRNGGEFLLQIRLELTGSRPDSPRSKLYRSIPITGRDQIFAAVAEAGRWIRSQAGESATALQETDRRPEDVTTPSWQALDLLRQADQRRSADKFEEALLLLNEAVKQDPNFALAYMRLADISFTLYRYEQGYAYWKSALDCMHKGRLTMREQLLIEGMYASDLGDWRGAEQAYGAYAAHYPNDPLSWFYRGTVQLQLTEAEAARDSLLRAEKLDPDGFHIAFALAKCALFSGRDREAVHYTQRLRSLGRSPYADGVDGNAAFLRGEHKQSFTVLSRLQSATDPYWRSESYLILACVYAELGRYREAISVLNQGMTDAFPSGQLTARAERLIALASLHLRSGRIPECQAAARQAMETDHGLAQDTMAGVLFARSGLDQDAEAILKRLEKLADATGVRAAMRRVRGELSLAHGEVEDALKDLQEAADLMPRLADDSFLGRALERAGQPQRALAVYKRIADSPAILWLQPEISLPGAWSDTLFDYARLSIRLGGAEGKDALNVFLRLRSGADPELPQMRVAAVLEKT